MKKIETGVNILGFKEVKGSDKRLKSGVDIVTQVFKNDIKKEEDLFNFLKENVVSDLTKAKDEFSVYDCYSASQKTIIELKVRGVHYDTLLIEKKKYDSLVKFDCNVRYICSTPRGVFSFNLKDLKGIKWEEQSHNKTTEFNNNNKVNKLVYNIPISKSIKIC